MSGKFSSLSDTELDEGFIIQREIELNKRPGEAFGITVGLVAHRAIITSVREVEVGAVCPATRCNLNFGDEIVSVNGVLVNSVVAVAQALEILHHSKQVKLSIREMPFFRLNALQRHSNCPVGLTFVDAIITEVSERSPASLGGIKAGHAIVSVNGECIIGRPDSYIAGAIKRGWGVESNQLAVTTMSARKYKELREAVLAMPLASRPSITSLINNVVYSPPMSRRTSSITGTPVSSPPLTPTARRSEPFTSFFSPPSSPRFDRSTSISGMPGPAARALARQDSLSSVLRRFSSAPGEPHTGENAGSPRSPRALVRSFRSMIPAASS